MQAEHFEVTNELRHLNTGECVRIIDGCNVIETSVRCLLATGDLYALGRPQLLSSRYEPRENIFPQDEDDRLVKALTKMHDELETNLKKLKHKEPS